jgi:hypothetical protein
VRAALGAARTGKRTAGRTTFGSGVTTLGGFSAALTEAVARAAYGRQRASRPIAPNQNRFRRDPSTPKLGVLVAPEMAAPAYAGIRKLFM